MVEVLGYHQLSTADRTHFEGFFAVVEVLPLNDAVVSRAVGLRQGRKMSSGDAPIAATALVFGRELLTHNARDFVGLPGLAVTDPLEAGDPASTKPTV